MSEHTDKLEQTASTGVDPMESFFTADKAAEGIRLPLTDPTGRPTDHWLHIIGVDCDEFKLADTAAKRRAVELSAIEDETERDKAIMEVTRNLTAKLVKGWSFDQPCTFENVVAFFKRAPQIQRAVDVAATSRRLFFKVESES